jgi:hypothetical protein
MVVVFPGKLMCEPSGACSAAELLVLRHDTLKLIDGAGPDALRTDQNKAEKAGANGKEPERQTVPGSERRDLSQTVGTAKEQVQTSTSPKCTFSRMVVSIDLKRFTDSGVTVVECASLFENAFAL